MPVLRSPRFLSGFLSGLVAVLCIAATALGAEVPGGTAPGTVVEDAPCFPEAGYEKAVAAEAAALAVGEEETPAEVAARLERSWDRETFHFLNTRVDGETLCRRMVYRSDGLRVVGYRIRPRPVGPGPDQAPVVIFVRGGNRDFGRLTRSSLFRFAEFARNGYVFLASQYRGVDGGEGQEEFGGAEVADVLALVGLVDELPYADPERIGLFGWSRGGMTTYQVLARTDRVRAAVVGGGVSDAAASLVHRPEMERVYAELVPGWPATRETALRERSVIRWVDRLSKTTPILLLHGGADWRVDVTQSLDLARALHEAGHPFRLVVFEGGDHGLREFRDEVDEQVLGWFERTLTPAAP